MSNAQSWTLLGLVGVLLGVIGLVVHQIRQVDDRLDARIAGLESTVDARFTGLASTLDARFDAVSRRFDHLDRDVQAIAGVVFPCE